MKDGSDTEGRGDGKEEYMRAFGWLCSGHERMDRWSKGGKKDEKTQIDVNENAASLHLFSII